MGDGGTDDCHCWRGIGRVPDRPEPLWLLGGDGETAELALGHAQTMAFVTLSASELFRAYTARSERYSLFSIGVFGNKWMQWAVTGSLLVLLATVYIPGLNTQVFGNEPLDLADWLVVSPLMLVPAVAAEVHKAILLRQSRQGRQETAAA